MKFRLLVNSIAVAGLFGQWQGSLNAALFMFVLCGFVLSCIDYAKGEVK